MPETIRIRTTPNGSDKYLKVKIDQEFDFIEVLSLKISQEEAYRNFCSDYGVVAGRVIINSGFGLANARVSVFIPIDEDDKKDSVIKGLYPYEIISDKDSDGIRYNLLPKNSESNNPCFTPVGTFPNKREILDNPELEYVYCKYYKFTTTTNNSGDFMIFGVPLGTYTIHVDADISDIGIASQRPYDLISQGTPISFFDGPTKYKKDTNLDKLVQIKTTNYSVDVQPFWGDTDNCEIGISRADIDMNYNIIPSAIFMGGIFGDQEKNSVNKRCRPRKKMGEICSQVAGEGSIEMIRETMDGGVEQFDVEGGRLIDEDGTWSYQVPMNLDYVVTGENGDLIFSDDPNKGIPTRASVRFRIGMDNTGGEGRLRTRAKYLVPNNPQNKSEIDYNFDEKTKKSSFKNLFWNKIYTVSNFIPRFQTNNLEETRAFTGVKNVDNCPGDKTPFPFNRLNTDFNPIFFYICLIIKIVAFIIWIINKVLIPLINGIVEGLNAILKFICNIIFGIGRILASFPSWLLNVNECSWCIGSGCCNCNDVIGYVGCIFVDCPFDPTEKERYAPGCKSGTRGFTRASQVGTINFYPGDSNGHTDSVDDFAAGLDKCVAFQVAKLLGMFEFDFYNDWINGSLFGYLIKYKKKKRKRELFCEYDCNPDYFSQGGVDGNKNNVGDNDCHKNFLLDKCFPKDGDSFGNANNAQNKGYSSILKEGLIKKLDIIRDGKKISEEFYYAATKHDTGFKLFATDIVCLGSVFDCDWQGIPKVQPLLIPTSYKIPPDTVELDDNNKPETTGQIALGGNIQGLFFTIDCIGLHSNYKQILNIRHLCEIGVNIDEITFDANNNEIPPDAIIGAQDIDENGGKWVRDVFFDLNKNINSSSSFNHGATFTTNFNIRNDSVYPFASNATYNGQDYLNFRGYQNNSDNGFGQPKHSYYFYFGIMPGKSALEKMNQKFFTACYPKLEQEFNVIATSTAVPMNGTIGTITYSIISGTANFTYTITGPNGFVTQTGTVPLDNTGKPIPQTINAPQGTYTIEIIDANGNSASQTVNIDGPPSLYANAIVNKMTTSAAASDGEISIVDVGGGTGTYNYELYSSNGNIVKSGQLLLTNGPLILNNLAGDTNSSTLNSGSLNTGTTYGYSLKVSDGISDTWIRDLVIDGPTAILLNVTTTATTCYDSSDGSYNVSILGGRAPYTITVTGPSGYNGGNVLQTNQAIRGGYTITVVDGYSTTSTTTFTMPYLNGQMGITRADSPILAKQCDPNNYLLTFKADNGGYTNLKVQYELNDSGTYYDIAPTTSYVNNSTPVVLTIPKSSAPNLTRFKVRIKSLDDKCYSNIITFNEANVRLPNTTLSVNENGINNTKQCDANTVTFKFNISHLQINPNYTERKPYTFKYKINGYGPNGTTSSEYTETINTNQQEIVATLPSQNLINSSNSAEYPITISYTITDNKGCTATGSLNPITMPAQNLTVNVIKTGTEIANSTPKSFTCKFKFVTTGGLTSYTGIPYTPNVDHNAGDSTGLTAAICDNKPIIPAVTTIKDRVGCQVIKSTS